MGELAEEDWDEKADRAEYDHSIAKRLNEEREQAAREANERERNRLVEAFAYALVSGLCEVTSPDAKRIIRSADRLADALLRRRAARGGV